MASERMDEPRKAIRESSRGGTIFTWRELPARGGKSVALPPDLHPARAGAIAAGGVERLYTHQAEAWGALRGGENVEAGWAVNGVGVGRVSRHRRVRWAAGLDRRRAGRADRGD